MTFRKPFAALSGLLCWAGLGVQLWLAIAQRRADHLDAWGGVANYLSFFTILTDLLIALALTAPLIAPRTAIGRFFARPSVHTGIAMSAIVVGVTYTLLLRGLWSPQGWHFFADTVLHDVMPVLFLLHWILFTPKGNWTWRDLPRWSLYPIFYLEYSLLRGRATGVYPYPFIDARALGYGRTTLNCIGMLIGFMAAGFILIGLDRLKKNAAGSVSPARE